MQITQRESFEGMDVSRKIYGLKGRVMYKLGKPGKEWKELNKVSGTIIGMENCTQDFLFPCGLKQSVINCEQKKFRLVIHYSN